MPVVPINHPAAKSSIKTSSSTSPSRHSKVTFDEWNLREEWSYPCEEKTTGELKILQAVKRISPPPRHTTQATRAAAVARTGQRFAWQPAESLGEGLLMEVSEDLDFNKMQWKECKPKATPLVQFQVERICDSGAATALASIMGWIKQGLPRQLVNETLT